MFLRSLLLLATIFASVVTGYAQAVAGFGGISGVVRDASGAVIPNAAVIVGNESKGIKRNLTTNDSGVFTAPALVPASGYRVEVTAQGFGSYTLKDVTILVGQNLDLNVRLEVTTSATSVEVSSEAPLVETTRTGNSQVVDSQQILNLPINGRRVDSFVLLTPAVVSDGTFGLVSFRGIAGGNTYLTDGNDTTNGFYNENAGRTRITTQISQDAVQEFEVKTNGYSAEFGRASGGVINTVTRSGTNDLHGTAYWFFRNRSLNARDPYSAFNPPESRHQAGGSIGGNIVKDKLFYFFNGETTRRNFPLVASMTRPPLFNADGTFAAAATTGCTASPQQCETARRFFDRQFGTLPRTANSELLFGKLDWRPNDTNAFSASFNYLRWISPLGIQTQAVLNNGQGVGGNADSTVRTRYGRLSWTAIPSATVVNEARFGWFKDRLFDDFNASLVPAVGPIGISVAGQGNVGVADAYPRLNPSENRFQFADNLTWTVGRHTLKAGFDFVNTFDYNDILRNRFGSYSYANFTNFALDLSGNATGARRWQSYSQRFGNPVAETWVRDWNFYVQDQFRVSKSLTFNYGVRYEYAQFSQPTQVNPDYPQTGRIPEPGKNFAPRVGLAYAFNNNKTVLRAGYGIFYARFQGGMINSFFLENGIYQRNISLNFAVPADLAAGPVFPANLPSLDRNPPPGTVSVTFAAPNYRNPYTQQGDISIDHELTRTLGLTVSYLWSRGKRLTTVRDLNVGPLGPPVTFRINDASANQVGTYTTPTYRLANRVDPRWQRVNQVENGANQYYDGLVVQLNKRLSRGLQAQVSYTWSHAIDFNQGGGNDNIFFSGGPRSLFNGDYRGDKSSSSLDQRHRFVGNFVYAPVLSRGNGWASKYLANNWQLSGIVTLASAQPATPTIFVAGAPFTGAAFNNSLNGFGASSRVPFVPAASLDIDRIHRLDARLTKILPITDRMNVQLAFEAFNVFNHVSDTSVNGQAYSAAGGVLTPTARLGEGSASQGFPDGTNARRAQVSVRFVF